MVAYSYFQYSCKMSCPILLLLSLPKENFSNTVNLLIKIKFASQIINLFF